MNKMKIAGIVLGVMGAANMVLLYACVRAGAKADERMKDLCCCENWMEDDDWDWGDADGEE